MLFNSIDFAVFLPIVFILYWFLFKSNLKLQNLLIVVSSYVFYGWWDWRFLSLIVFSTAVDYTVGQYLRNEENQLRRKVLLWTSILVNLGFLCLFKYYNFFIDNFTAAFSFFGTEISASSLDIILPVGISFYTFQTLSYTIDVYKQKLEPTKDIIAFSAFVSFFPQLVAGPIERATNLLPQFYKERKFDYSRAVDGMRQILWGLFKKIVIADNCAQYANEIFNNSADYGGSTLILGALFFTFQIYGDFSGYSDIAIGTSRLFGFNLKQNFAFPYFSRDIAEFWRRWHISLSTWFRDYLYIPLGGSRGGAMMKVRNTFIIFIVSGFWHGANWTFIVWGALNAIYFLPILLTNRNRKNIDTVASGRLFPSPNEFLSMGATFGLTVIAWVFFRAENMGHAMAYISEIFSSSTFNIPEIRPRNTTLLIIGFLVIEWYGRGQQFAIQNLGIQWKRPFRYALYYAIIILIFWFGGKEQEFIYFQF
ncbi:MAG: MBOAT family protein [Flavobacteriales bacterium]|jgi:D-alanyl-lipoteichoic acid acyltransferase DltB (MBOAT superfamily)|nr:MBOAT family protein [Flavobacteriales bacterium]MBT3963668.1 MBOAT family protein [Flavobacteriales bacterium]MBT4704786.1 MBOAT family protein [Flavobacteriales bacterium]MBT4931631.1 MBOAT family protein [Flavobacteriales bacterium]MBT5133597.1 MBOAT family protein [Flavobacteriales bacterium]